MISDPFGVHLVDLPAGRRSLNTAAEGLPIRGASIALQRALNAKRRGSLGRNKLYKAESVCREVVADLLGVTPAEVALVPETSTGIERPVNAITWREGDEVLLNDLEFPRNAVPWLEARNRYGIRVRVLPTSGGTLNPDEVAHTITERTRVVSLSHVSFKSGGRNDLESIAKVAHGVSAIVCVDASQTLGVVFLSLGTCDVIWSSGYKWLSCVPGVAVIAVRERMQKILNRGTPGWRSVQGLLSSDRVEHMDWRPDATRFHVGMSSFGQL